MQPKKFRFTLSNGSDPNELPNAPDDWLKTTIKYKRDTVYGGVVRSLTGANNFVRDAASYLRQAVYTQGINSRRYLLLEKLNPKNWSYRQLFNGRIDFTTYKDNLNGFIVNAKEKAITTQIDANDSIDYALPLIGDDVITVTLPPIQLAESADFIAQRRDDYSSQCFPGLTLVTNQQLANVASAQGVDYDQLDFSGDSPHWYLRPTVETNVRLQIHLDVNGFMSGVGASGQFQINLYKSTTIETAPTYILLDEELNSLALQNFVKDLDISIHLNSGERLYLFVRHVDGAGGVNQGYIFSPLTTITASYKTITPASQCLAISGSDVYKRLIAKINQGEDMVITQSVLLATELSPLYYTCQNSILTSQIDNIYQAGDTLQQGASYVVLGASIDYFLPNGTAHTFAINDPFAAVLGQDTFTSADGGFARQVSLTPQLIINFKDYFKDIYGIKAGQACFGVDNYKACLEDLSFACRQTITTLALGKKISNFEVSPNLDRAFNTIKVGQADQQYDAINGAMEVASEARYKTALDIIQKELDLTVAHRYDPYGIEQIRAIPANVYGNTAASRSDNSVFMLWLNDARTMPLTVAAGCMQYSGIGGDYYNWPLSPAHNLKRGGRFLRSCLDNMDGSVIAFVSGDKNTAMITIDNAGNRVAEGEDIKVNAGLGSQIFKPHLFTFDCFQDNSAGIALNANPYGAITCEFLEIPIKGFAVEVETNEGDNSSQKFVIEASADMDMTTLIR